MTFESLRVSFDDRVAVLELDHGKANEMGSEQLRELERLVGILQADHAALITFSRRRSRRGTPIFVAGANVTEREGWDDEDVKDHVRWQRRVLSALSRAPVFHIVVASGVALGWGTEFMLTGDYRIATDEAEFGLPETGLGILPGAGGTSDLWAHVGPAQALRLGMTGEQITADEAYRIGLVQERTATLDEGLVRAHELARLASRRSPTALAQFKAGVLASLGATREERMEIEARAYERCVDSGDAAIGRANFSRIRAGETPVWRPRR